jgi:hypothetical protein
VQPGTQSWGRWGKWPGRSSVYPWISELTHWLSLSLSLSHTYTQCWALIFSYYSIFFQSEECLFDRKYGSFWSCPQESIFHRSHESCLICGSDHVPTILPNEKLARSHTPLWQTRLLTIWPKVMIAAPWFPPYTFCEPQWLTPVLGFYAICSLWIERKRGRMSRRFVTWVPYHSPRSTLFPTLPFPLC